ncbi:hypothetical protein V1224_05160 [Lachnospiraceae bacterium JLR.KK008]
MTPQEIWDQINNFVMDTESDEAVCNTLLKLYYARKEDEAIKYIEDFFKCDNKTAEDTFNIFREKTGAPPSQEQIAHANAVAKELLNKPKCPICGSKNLSKYNSFGKALKMAKYGIFGMYDNGKTYICNNCGSKF